MVAITLLDFKSKSSCPQPISTAVVLTYGLYHYQRFFSLCWRRCYFNTLKEFLRSAHLQLTSHGKDYLHYPTFQSVHLFIQGGDPYIGARWTEKPDNYTHAPTSVVSTYTRWPFYHAQVASLYYRSRERQDLTISWMTALFYNTDSWNLIAGKDYQVFLFYVLSLIPSYNSTTSTIGSRYLTQLI